MTACLSDLCLDELITGELAPDAAAAATGHLDDCMRCRERERTLVEARAHFRAAMPPLRRRRWTRRAVIGAAAGALASAAAVVLVLHRAPDETRTKGGPRLGLVIVRGEVMLRARAGDRVHPGDTLSYLVATAAPAHVAVVGRDAAGRISTYVPLEQVPAGRDIQLTVATVLDGTLGVEQLYGVFCAAPIAEPALRATPDRAPPGCIVDRIDIEKVP